MKRSDLAPETVDRIKALRYDRLVGKHEVPERWDAALEIYEPEFMEVDGRWVLVPVEAKNHIHITIVRSIVSADGQMLTLFLKDTTYVTNPREERYEAGRLAICERLNGFYVALVYHEWFIVGISGLEG